MDKYEKEELIFCGKLILGAILIIFIIFSVMWSFGAFLENNTCNNYAKIDTSRQYEWFFFGGCLVELDSGQWVHYSRVNLLNVQGISE